MRRLQAYEQKGQQSRQAHPEHRAGAAWRPPTRRSALLVKPPLTAVSKQAPAKFLVSIFWRAVPAAKSRIVPAGAWRLLASNTSDVPLQRLGGTIGPPSRTVAQVLVTRNGREGFGAQWRRQVRRILYGSANGLTGTPANTNPPQQAIEFSEACGVTRGDW